MTQVLARRAVAPGPRATPRGAPAPPPRPGRRPATGFSLVELVIVITILAIVAAIALRRVSRHAEQGAANGARQDEKTLQSAIERYRAEHGNYPPATNVADLLTKYTDASGNTSDTRTPPYTYGPYVRKIPPVPLGPARGSTQIATAAAAGVGWVYDPDTGSITANETPAP
jgi:general secretion pathway protein G